ncbi:M64 family metallopeptidase [Streptomyces sp. M19]
MTRNTALASHFFCDDVERLLCVDTGKVDAYAKKAQDADLVVVLGNSTKYGGAGYSTSGSAGYDGIATASAGHPDSDQIAVHETGHSWATSPTSTPTTSTASTPATSPASPTPPSSPPTR